jgi:acetoin utilization deacetylase AcuC-like enzyme
MSARRTGFVCHELYMWHNTGNYAGIMPYGNPVQPYEHAENPETKRRFRNLVEASGFIKQLTLIEPREATEAEIMATVFPHPTMSEAMHEATLAAYGRAIHL